ncbi:spondin domain-containing protein [Photobacterium profundum]|uniref:spondin domain-containing protein n=1 Tax=Photobacterium profundum TaxID=74109 RepID=UPI003D125395
MKFRLIAIAVGASLLVGCHDDDHNIIDDNNDDTTQTTRSYTVTVKNLTPNQPLSPLAVLAHNDQYRLFSVGEAASDGLEILAESGDNSSILAEKETNTNVGYSFSGTGVVLPGNSDTITFTIDPTQASLVSVASMLVNTNDGFVGETQLDLTSLAVGASLNMNMAVWDSGTENNDESTASIPGPAAGGEGFNSARDDNNRVSFHAGVISLDDGLATSVLNATHRFLNPGAQLSITRTE